MDDGGGQFYQILYTVVEFVSQVVYIFILFVLVRALKWAAFSACEPQTQTQTLSRPYLKRLAALYCNQTGDVNGKTFPIRRGVKQGDVISPLLFNAGLEHDMRKWKLRLQH